MHKKYNQPNKQGQTHLFLHFRTDQDQSVLSVTKLAGVQEKILKLATPKEAYRRLMYI